MDEQVTRTPSRYAPPPPRKGTGLRALLGLIVLIAAVVALIYYHPWRKPDTAAGGANGASRGGRFGNAQAQSVSVGEVAIGQMPITINALGTVTSLASVTVFTQISGVLQQVGFQEGQMVKVGDFLAQIDPRPYQAALESAQGSLAKDQALLANA
jgi:multidrug efflux system membrane fusion protein